MLPPDDEDEELFDPVVVLLNLPAKQLPLETEEGFILQRCEIRGGVEERGSEVQAVLLRSWE